MNLEYKIQKSIKFLQTISKKYNDLHLAFSGGKDSVVIYKLAELSGIDFKAFHNNTTIDPIGTIPFIKRNYPNVTIKNPKESFYKLIERKGFPTRLNRYCCEYLKEYGSIGKNVIEGVRADESTKRSKRTEIFVDTRKNQKGAIHFYPILDWTDADVWLFIAKYDLPVAPAYHNGFNRLGCVGCPLVTRKGVRVEEFRREPKKYHAIKRAIDKGMRNNPQWKLTKLTKGNSDLAMEWWLSGKTMNEFNFNQKLFDVPISL